MRLIRVVLATAYVVICPMIAAAQETAIVVPIVQTEFDLQSAWLAEFRADFVKGDVDNLGKKATEFLDDLKATYHRAQAAATVDRNSAEASVYTALQQKGIVCCDYERNYYLLLFTAVDAQGKAVLASTLVHAPEPSSPTLPGLDGPDHPLYEIFVAEDRSVTISGYYEVKRTEDPALKSTADFVTTTLGKLGLPNTINRQIPFRTAQTAMLMQSAALAPPPPPPAGAFRHSVSFGAVTFETRRAELIGRHTVVTADPMGHLRATIDATALQLRDARMTISIDETLLRGFYLQRERQQRAVPTMPQGIANQFVTAPPAPPPPIVGAVGASAVRCDTIIKEIAEALKQDLESGTCAYALSDQSACQTQMKKTIEGNFAAFKPGASCSQADAREIALAFQTSIQPDLAKVTGANTLTNAPRQRFSFGLATGFIGGIGAAPGQPRANIQNGKIAADPFVRSISMGIVNLPLWGYDATTPSISPAERFKPFVGVSFTPYFGATAGGSWWFSRYLGVSLGYARLWYDTPKNTEFFDQAPVDKAAPFRLGSTNAWFIAASYNLGGK